MGDLAAPLLLCGDGQVELFSTIEDLAAWVEAPDLDLYEAFDAKGQRLRLMPGGPGATAHVYEPERVEPAALAEHLRAWLVRVGPEEPLGISLDDLVWRCALIAGWQSE